MSWSNDNKQDGSGPKQPPAKFKFKEIKVHSSDEWMADGTKKYRQVYDRYWDATIALKCFYLNGSSSRELCNLSQQRKISKDENIVYIRDSWGESNPRSLLDERKLLVGSPHRRDKDREGKFYIEDLGPSKAGENSSSISKPSSCSKATDKRRRNRQKNISANSARRIPATFGVSSVLRTRPTATII
ncbi:MAG: hypothetical protein WDO15_22050 [Bacteroidota bacterium]